MFGGGFLYLLSSPFPVPFPLHLLTPSDLRSNSSLPHRNGGAVTQVKSLRMCQASVACLSSPVIFILSLLCPRPPQVSGINASMSRKREQRVLFMVVIMVVCYLLCWLPYGIMALLATFGPPGLVTPEASIIPSVLAKTSTVINPVIYVFMNKQVRRIVGGRALQSDRWRTSSRGRLLVFPVVNTVKMSYCVSCQMVSWCLFDTEYSEP